jgi:tetratricopeptide (TPR) repeat protein
LDPAIKSRDDEMWGKKLIHRELLFDRGLSRTIGKDQLQKAEDEFINAEKDCLENLQLLLSANNLDYAKTILNEIIPTCPEQQGPKLKIKLIEKLMSLTQESEDAAKILLDLLGDKNNANEVLKYYLQVQPNDYNKHYANVMYELGNLFYLQQRYKKAEQCLEKAIAANPDLKDYCKLLLTAIKNAMQEIPVNFGDLQSEYTNTKLSQNNNILKGTKLNNVDEAPKEFIADHHLPKSGF